MITKRLRTVYNSDSKNIGALCKILKTLCNYYANLINPTIYSRTCKTSNVYNDKMDNLIKIWANFQVDGIKAYQKKKKKRQQTAGKLNVSGG